MEDFSFDHPRMQGSSKEVGILRRQELHKLDDRQLGGDVSRQVYQLSRREHNHRSKGNNCRTIGVGCRQEHLGCNHGALDISLSQYGVSTNRNDPTCLSGTGSGMLNGWVSAYFEILPPVIHG